MTTDPDAGAEYTLERTCYGDQWHVDDEGYLHTGSGSSHIDSITIRQVGTSNE